LKGVPFMGRELSAWASVWMTRSQNRTYEHTLDQGRKWWQFGRKTRFGLP
jgi:hypothetical protein